MKRPARCLGLALVEKAAGCAAAASALLISLAALGCASAPFVPTQEDLAGFERSELRLAVGDDGMSGVDVEVGGELVHLMLDTGDYACLSVNSEILDRLDVEITGAALHSDLTGRVFRVRSFLVREIVLGSLVLHDVPGRENVNGPRTFDGTVGNGILANFGVMIDYAEGRMDLYPRGVQPELLFDEGWHRVSLREPPSRLPVRIEGVEGEFRIGFDTGGGGTIVSLGSDLGRALLESLDATQTEGTVNGVWTNEMYRCRLERVLIDGYDAGGSDCLVVPAAGLHGNGSLCGGLFTQNRVFLDQERQEMWFHRAGAR